jgi:hypothetical protein
MTPAETRILSALRKHAGLNIQQIVEILGVSTTHARRALDSLRAGKRIHVTGWHKTKAHGGKYIPVFSLGAGIDVEKIDQKDVAVRTVSHAENDAAIDRLRGFDPGSFDPFRVLRAQVAL